MIDEEYQNLQKRYDYFFNKDKRALFKTMNMNNFKILFESIHKTDVEHNKDVCIFNFNSYLNQLRLLESNRKYLDEVDHETLDTNRFEDFIKRQYDSKYSKLVKNPRIQFENFDWDDANRIAGNIMFFIVIPNFDRNDVKKIVVNLSKIALRFGYNYVAYDIDDTYGDSTYELKIQFEATYFPGNVKLGDYLWHITTKNIAHKIVDNKHGLEPRTQSNRGFNYNPRVYCFKIFDRELMKTYAMNSWKCNRKFIAKKEISNDIDVIKDNWFELIKKEYGTLFDTREFSILQIDTTKLKNCKFYRDNSFEIDKSFVAVYTDSNIPYDAIKIVEEFTI